MQQNVIFLDENEIDRRIHEAVKQVNTGSKSKIYGVSGIGGENPILARTYDAAGIDLNLTTNDNLIECVATDKEFQKFFDFPEYTDELGNVFLTITPKAFKFDRTSNGEVTAISVKEYEDGDEEKGYEVHPFFKNWTSEDEYDGVFSRDIAKYMSVALNKETGEIFIGEVTTSNSENIVVSSKPNLSYAKSYAFWAQGRKIVKSTSEKYSIMSWMFIDLFRQLTLIYFARTDIHNFFGLKFSWNDENSQWDGISVSQSTGTTNLIKSHTGFNKTTNQYKIFNIDAALAGISVEGCYQAINGFYYSHLFDFDASVDNGKLSVIDNALVNYGEGYGLITKISYDTYEPAFKMATAQIAMSDSLPEDKLQNIYYSCKSKLYSFKANSTSGRGSVNAFSYWNYTLFPDAGIWFAFWQRRFHLAWGGIDYGLRLCKAPF